MATPANSEAAEQALRLAGERLEGGELDGARKFAEKARKLGQPDDLVDRLLERVRRDELVRRVLGASDLFELMGVTREAFCAKQLKKKYHAALRDVHPDKCDFAGADAASQRITEAYRILADDFERGKYLMQNPVARAAPQPTGGPPPTRPATPVEAPPKPPPPKAAPKAAAPKPPPQGQHGELAQLLARARLSDLREMCKRLNLASNGNKRDVQGRVFDEVAGWPNAKDSLAEVRSLTRTHPQLTPAATHEPRRAEPRVWRRPGSI